MRQTFGSLSGLRWVRLFALLLILGWLIPTLGLPAREGPDKPEDIRLKPAPLKNCINLGILKKCAVIGFSPDSRFLATATETTWRKAGPIQIWDVRTGQLQAAVAKDWTEIETVRFSPDSTLIAAHEQSGELRVWDVRTGESRGAFTPPTQFGNGVDFWFAPDGRAVLYHYWGQDASSDSHLKVWDIGSRHEVGSVEGSSWLDAFAPDGKRLATHDKRNGVMLWVWVGDKQRPAKLIAKHEVRLDHLAFSPDLTAFATGNNSADKKGTTEIRVRDLETGRERTSFTHVDNETSIQNLWFSPDGRVLAASGGGGTQLDWTTRTTLWDIIAKPPKRIGAFPDARSSRPMAGSSPCRPRRESCSTARDRENNSPT